MAELTLDQAAKIVDATLAEGRRQNLRPLTVAVLDEGGVLKAFKREDHLALMRPEIAFGKAWGCLGMGVGARRLAQMAETRPAFMTSLIATSEGRMVPVPGGVLIRNDRGAIIGAVGVSGDTSEADEACAVAGIEAAGLKADTGA